MTEIVTFLPEEVLKTVDVKILDDTNVEFNENFFLYLTSGQGVQLSPFSRAEVVIVNDDGEEYLTANIRSSLSKSCKKSSAFSGYLALIYGISNCLV